MEIDKRIASDYLTELISTLKNFPMESISTLGTFLYEIKDSATIFIAGNGGSATTASHMATDLGVGSIRRRNPIKAISLCDNNAVLTAISNDVSYEEVFSSQITLLAKSGDVLITFSASGNSPSILKAISVAQSMGVHTVAITGFDGGMAAKIADSCIHIETRPGSYGVVEDVHLSVSHVLTEIVRSFDE